MTRSAPEDAPPAPVESREEAAVVAFAHPIPGVFMMPHSTDCCALAPDGKNAAVATTAAEAATVATADAIGARLKTFMGCFRGGCLLRLTGNLPFRRNTEVGLATHCLGVFCFDNELLVCIDQKIPLNLPMAKARGF